MPSSKNSRTSDPDTATSRTVDRRSKVAENEEDQEASSRVRFDAKGNPVFEIRTNTPRRRKDDDTIDLLKCLENDSLTLADDD